MEGGGRSIVKNFFFSGGGENKRKKGEEEEKVSIFPLPLLFPHFLLFKFKKGVKRKGVRGEIYNNKINVRKFAHHHSKSRIVSRCKKKKKNFLFVCLFVRMRFT